MISQVDLRHFKCFESLRLPLQPLTLLSGSNASGKSSVMQALALLHQTIRENERASRLMLNGNCIRLGTAKDVIDKDCGRQGVNISISDAEDAQVDWEFEGGRHDMSLAVRRVEARSAEGKNWHDDGDGPLRHLLPDDAYAHLSALIEGLHGLTYLTAERLGPREQYSLSDPELTFAVGSRGENAASALYSRETQQVLEKLAVPGVPRALYRQVEAWMGRFFPDFGLEVHRGSRSDNLTLGIRTSLEPDYHRPVHAGFGITQAFPIVVAALSAGKDEFLLIENPESHLHPAAQGAIGEFLSLVASAGVQVLVETHSDHVLNGIRRAVRDGTLSCREVALYFFRQRDQALASGKSQVESMLIDRDGNIDTWPSGFFDQFDIDMNYFAGWS